MCNIGDAITIMAGTYTELGLNLNKNNVELWFEIGTIIDPASGIGLTLSGDFCRIEGNVKITPSGDIGLLISGDECIVSKVKVIGGTNCYSITGSGIILKDCNAGFPSSGNCGYSITGAQTKIISCSTVGNTTSYGYKINSGADTGVISDCTSVNHQTSGYYIATGSQDWTIVDCSTGAGDGKWRDLDSNNVWSGFIYPETKYKEITLNGSGSCNLFKVTGGVDVQEIYGHVSTELVGTNANVYLQLSSSAGSSESMTLTTGTPMGTAVVGSIVMKTKDPIKAIVFFDGAGVGVDKGVDPKKRATVINADVDSDTFIKWVVTTEDTGGVLHFHVVWRPLSDDGNIEPV